MNNNNLVTNKHAGKNGKPGVYTQNGFVAARPTKSTDKRPICWHCGQRKNFGHFLVCKGKA